MRTSAGANDRLSVVSLLDGTHYGSIVDAAAAAAVFVAVVDDDHREITRTGVHQTCTHLYNPL